MKRFYLLFITVALLGSLQNSFAQCSTSSTPGHTCFFGDWISSFTLNSISNNSGGCSSGGYGYFSSPTWTLNSGTTYSVSAVYGNSSYSQHFAIWIDLNNNGTYESSEQLYTTSSSGFSTSGTITIPASATASSGIAMRTACRYSSSLGAGDACASYTYGEVEDYTITIVNPPCSGTPTPGNTVASSNPVCSGTNFILSTQNSTSGSGVTYQWQSSANGTTGWTNISGATSATYTTSITSATYYRCNVTCSGNTGTSNPLQVTTDFKACYCTAANTSGCSFGDNISNVTFGTLNNSSGCVGAAPSYISYIGSVAAPSLNIGSSNTLSVSVGSGGTENVAAWIDYDHSGTFDASEFTFIGTRSSSGAVSNTVTIPPTALTGTTGMRVRVRYSSSITSGQACTNFSYGETEDYEVNLVCPALTVANPPNTTMCPGGNATISAVATTGSGLTPIYQWQVSTNSGSTWSNVSNTGVYSGATTASLMLTAAPNTMAGYQYRVIAANACDNKDTSNAATLSFYTPPTITANPANSNVCPGNTTTFSCTVTGPNLSYQWEVSTNGGSTWSNATGTGYSGANSNTLVVSNASASLDNNQYRCIITNPCVATTTAATLTVFSKPAVTSSPSNVILCVGDNHTFTCSGTGTGIGYQWQEYNGTVWSNISNTGVYSGATTASLGITGATAGMDNYKYRCVISGTCTPDATTAIATLDIGDAPVVTSQPSSLTACNGTTSSMSITGTGYNITYQWQVSTNSGATWSNVMNTTPYSGVTTPTITFNNTPLALNGNMYRCVVTNGCSVAANSNPATLNVATSPNISSQPASSVICVGNNTSFSVTATSSTTISYQWQARYGTIWGNLSNSSNYSGVTTPTLTITNAQTWMAADYRCVLNTGCLPATTTNGNATLTVNEQPVITSNPVNKTICQGSNASFYVVATGSGLTYQWQESTNGGSTWSSISNGSAYSGTQNNVLVINSATPSFDGNMYRCLVNGVCPTNKVSTSAMLTVNTNVTINSQSAASTTICSGGSATMSVSATGTGISYQWYEISGSGSTTAVTNNSIYSGATTSTLSINGITATGSAKTFWYFCRVSGTCVPASSGTKTLTVNAKPAVTSNPTNKSICENSNVLFNITANGTNISTQWQISTNGGSSWSNLANSATYSGVTTAALQIFSASYSLNGNRYRCVVSGTCTPTVTSSSAILTVIQNVQPALSISSSTGNTICDGTSVKFTANPTNGGSSPSYQWTKNNNNIATGSTYTTSTLANGDVISCFMVSNAPCPVPTTALSSNTITMTVIQNVAPTIGITSDEGTSWCSGKPATFRSSITNGGNNPTYQWKVNGNNMGLNADTFVAASLNDNDVVECELTSSLMCAVPQSETSNKITMTINPTTRSSIVISVNPDSSVCDQQEVTLYTAFTNGGATPAYQWIRNGVDMPGETNGTLKSTTLSDGDVITCRFISSNTCVFPEVSNPIAFDIAPLLNPSVSVAVTYNGNDSYTYTALPVNGGANPVYQWYRNSVMIPGATGNTYTATELIKGNDIYVQMVSSEPCVEFGKQSVSSNIIVTNVGGVENMVNELGLHPNPNKGQFNITGQLNKTVTDEIVIKITNSVGQTVYTTVYTPNGNNLNIPVQLGDNLPNGMYMVNMVIEGELTNMRFMITR